MSKPHILLTTMDLEVGTSTFIRSDGKEATFDTGFTRDPNSRVARIQYSPPLHGVLMTTTAGDQIAMPLVTRANPAEIGERPVVYLDQNQWSGLARLEAGDALTKEEDDRAARQLINWAATEHSVILPVSSGHCVETTEWSDNERRYRLGLTLMRLSAAWQARHPLDVERDELMSSLNAFLGREHVSPSVFSADPESFTPEQDRGGFQPGDDFPEEYRETFESLLHLSATFDLLTDGTVIDRQRLTAWREAQQTFSDHLDTLHATSDQKRQLVLAFFVNDITHAIANAATALGISDDEFTQWLQNRLMDDLPKMPYLGLRYEFLVGKHANRGVRWHDNDLIDMMYLCLGGAYADIVVCESSAASHIRQAQKRLGRPETAVSKFPAAVEYLELRRARMALAEDAGGNPTPEASWP